MLHPSKAAVTRELRRLARPPGQFDASRYFRGDTDLGFYNVGTQAVRGVAKEIYHAHRDWNVEDALALADALIEDRFHEVKAVGIDVLAHYRRSFTPRLLTTWKRWLADGHSSNWATTDAICGFLIGPLLVAHPRLAPGVSAWARSRNMWVRRASAVSLIPLARKGLALDLVYQTARKLHADREDLIQKAVGWMLREVGKADMVRLEKYLRTNGPMIPRTTVRYAIERMSDTKRRSLLKATRSNGR